MSYWRLNRLLIELGDNLTAKKYNIMPAPRFSLFTLLFCATILFASSVHADEIKDITQLASQGQQAAALNRINTYVSNNPQDVQGLFVRGVLLTEMNRRDEAIKVFTDITEKFPSLPEPYNNLAVLYADQGQYDKARKALESAIKTHPSYATAHENLGDIYARMASEAYDKALQLDNSNERAQGKLALIKDLFSTSSRPTTVAAKNSDTAKPSDPVKSTPVTPPAVKPAEPIKPAEAPKPVDQPKVTEPAKPVEPAAVTASSEEKNISSAVDQWAKAWSDKNTDQYLARYAENFSTPNGESRAEWEKVRRERISKPASINVGISNLRIKMENATTAKASFSQNYRAGTVSKRTSKTLVMQKVRGNWLITQELTDR